MGTVPVPLPGLVPRTHSLNATYEGKKGRTKPKENFLQIILCIYLFLAVLGFQSCTGFSLVAMSRGCSLAVGQGLLTVGASPVEHALSAMWISVAPRLSSTDPVIVAHGLRCSTACEIFPDQGSNLCLLHWQPDSLAWSHRGAPRRTLNGFPEGQPS